MTDHPFREHRARTARAVKDAPLHAPCPKCYSDCSPPTIVHREGLVSFHCKCSWTFTLKATKARSHTSWLLTRGRAQVQSAIATERQ